MPLPVTSQFAPPQSWEEFESLCCDLYERLWNDRSTQKHGRQGQPQGGVDVYGRPDGKNYAGVQCKEKAIWPPKDLTIDEIDEEVTKAKTWKPGLKQYVVATTAPNDDKVQAHARAITAKHKRKRLFSVEVASWDQITRQLANYPDLLRKYGYISDIAETAKLVAVHLRESAPSQSATPRVATPSHSPGQEPAVVEAVERDLAARFTRAMRRSLFPETAQTDEYVSVADIACEPEYTGVSPELRRRILLRAARSAAVRGTTEKAQELLRQAQKLKGQDSDLLARARILERTDIDGALSLIRDETDADSRSSVFNMLVRHRSPADGLQWLADSGMPITQLTINGLQTLVSAYLQSEDYDGLRPRLEEITPTQLSEGPYFRFVRAMVSVASILPVPDRELAVRSFQMDARRGTRSIVDDATTASRMDKAMDDLTALLPIASELELPHAKRLAEGYILWCELLHPHRKTAGLNRLREELKDPKLARERLSLAFAFDPEFKPEALDMYLKRREELGGLDGEDLKAALIIRIHSDDPASVASLISRYRARFEADYKDPPIFPIEIQALALAGDTSSARILFEKHREELTPDGAAMFDALIAKCEGKDPVAEDLKLYEATKSLESLRALVGSLSERKDHRATAKYSEDLFAQSSDPRDIARAAYAFAYLGDDPEYVGIIEANPVLKDRDPELLRHYAWALFKQGRLKEAKDHVDKLAQQSVTHRDLQLEIAIAIESGEWETLAKPLAAYLDNLAKYSGLELIRAAHIAQQSGHGPMMDLVRAAVTKAGTDPHVWLGAYSLIIEEGLEDGVPESHLWLRKALALSDKKGPVQQFELKELIPQQIEWNKRTRDISERITRAEVPLVIAAPGLRTTLVDMLLRNLVRNSKLEDARRKYVLPLFSGHRLPWTCGDDVQSLALDVSSILVLGWLGLLPKVLRAFKTLTLPATVMSELFEGRRRVQQVQKSRILRARELEQALRRNSIKIARPIERTNDPLSAEIGPSLAALVRSAEAGGTVLRPAPIHRPSLEQIPADITSIAPFLSDMHALLKVLSDNGTVNETEEQTAQEYFSLQDKGIPNCTAPDPAKPLFIDELALVYLQYTNLLGAVLKVFKDVRIEGSSEDEAQAIIDHDQHVGEVLRVIDDIRDTIRATHASGKVQFGPRRVEGGELNDDQTPSTLHLLSDLTGIDGVVCDDRALNKENFAADNKGRRVPCLTTLDLLETLRVRDVIKDPEWFSARHKLRTGAAALLPVHVSEVARAASRSRVSISAEMRAIQESIDLAKVAEVPTFPREIQWFASVSLAMKSGIFEIWKAEADPVIAARLSNLIMSSLPRPQDWEAKWEPSPPLQWVEAVDRVILSGLAMPVELSDDNVVRAYNTWLEQHYIEPLRSVWPDRYHSVIEQVRSFILNTEDENEKQEGGSTPPQTPTTKKKAPNRKAVGRGKAKGRRQAGA